MGGWVRRGEGRGRRPGGGARGGSGRGRAWGRGGSGEGAGRRLPQPGRALSGAHGAGRTARGLRTRGPRRQAGTAARTPALAWPAEAPPPARRPRPEMCGAPSSGRCSGSLLLLLSPRDVRAGSPRPRGSPGQRGWLPSRGGGRRVWLQERFGDLSEATQPQAGRDLVLTPASPTSRTGQGAA